MKNNPIGIFDSGIGGLSIVEQIKTLLPNESIIYLADKINFPYGDKTPNQIKSLSKRNVVWLLTQKAKIIVVACNTATVNSISYLRGMFPSVNFVGMEPAVKPAAKLGKKGIIILSSPKATKSKQLHSLINKFAKDTKVFSIGSLELVQAVEKQWSPPEIIRILKNLLPQKILNNTDTIVLGCTHFVLIREQIQKYVGEKIKVIDSGKAVVKRVKVISEEKELLSIKEKPNYKFYTTGKKEVVRRITFTSTKI